MQLEQSLVSLQRDSKYKNKIIKKDGLVIFRINQKDYLVTDHVVNEFIKDIPQIDRLRNLKRIQDHKIVIKHLFREFKSSWEVGRKNRLSQIIKSGFKESKYYWKDGMIYIVQLAQLKIEKDELITCYKTNVGKYDSPYYFMDESTHPGISKQITF
jgi:hypothetical protein